jgi:hypothetical protein
MKFSPVILAALLGTVVPGASFAGDIWTDPYPGVRHLHRTTDEPNEIHAIYVDLTRQDLRFQATRYDDRGKTVTGFAEHYGAAVAVNGDFYESGYAPVGLAVADGLVWPGTSDGTREGYLALGDDNQVLLTAPADVVPPAPWMSQVVSGYGFLVEDGAVAEYADTCTSSFCGRHPRTAVGLTQDGRTLIVVIVDGRTSESLGLGMQPLAELMIDLGAHRALNFDGGGSTALFVGAEGGLVSDPSGGTERTVANHLGLMVLRGEISGIVRDAEGQPVAGAQVTLSTGETTTTDAQGRYTFEEIPAGDVTITATAGELSLTSALTVADGPNTADLTLPEPPAVEPISGGCGVVCGGNSAGGAVLLLGLLAFLWRRHAR